MVKDNTRKVESLFHKIKNAFSKADVKEQDDIIDKLSQIKDNAEDINQARLMADAEVRLKNTQKELNAIKAGYSKYVLHDDVNALIQKLKVEDGGRQLAFTNLENFPRVIPQKNKDEIKQAQEYFDHVYVLYTANKDEVEKEKVAKDPIAFSVVDCKNDFDQDVPQNTFTQSQRMFFITDWVDEYCDLTLDKLVELSKQELQKNDILKTTEDFIESTGAETERCGD